VNTLLRQFAEIVVDTKEGMKNVSVGVRRVRGGRMRKEDRREMRDARDGGTGGEGR
jgi:hypothetical protein